MKRFFRCSRLDLLLGTIVAALLLLLLNRLPHLAQVYAGQESGAPRATIENDRVDLGRVETDMAPEATFWIRNDGLRRLILHRRASNCPCALARGVDVIVQPGQRAKLPVKVDARQLRGSMRLEVHYETNDPLTPEIKLVVLADVPAKPAQEQANRIEPLPARWQAAD